MEDLFLKKLTNAKTLLPTSIFLLTVCFFNTHSIAASQNIDHVKLHPLGWSDNLPLYFRKVVELALVRTQESTDDFKLEMYEKTVTERRALISLKPEGHLYVDFSTHIGAPGERTKTEQHFFPVLSYMLGLRKLVIRKRDQEKFSHLTWSEDFKRLSAGQPSIWPDTRVYRNAGIELKESVEFESLFHMLSVGRFDYIPLSIVEIEKSYRENYDSKLKLTIDAHNYIFYAIPLGMNISANNPKIKDRLVRGMIKITESGELKELFKSHFKSYLKHININQAKVLVLHNPEMTQTQNLTAIDQALEVYFQGKATVFRVSPNSQ